MVGFRDRVVMVVGMRLFAHDFQFRCQKQKDD